MNNGQETLREAPADDQHATFGERGQDRYPAVRADTLPNNGADNATTINGEDAATAWVSASGK